MYNITKWLQGYFTDLTEGDDNQAKKYEKNGEREKVVVLEQGVAAAKKQKKRKAVGFGQTEKHVSKTSLIRLYKSMLNYVRCVNRNGLNAVLSFVSRAFYR